MLKNNECILTDCEDYNSDGICINCKDYQTLINGMCYETADLDQYCVLFSTKD